MSQNTRTKKKYIGAALAMLATTITGTLCTATAYADCLATAPPTTYGQVKQTVTVASAGTYRVWSRVKAASASANSYYFQADAGCAYNMADNSAIPANTWSWVNYQDGDTTSVVDMNFTAGQHTLTYTGKEANVQLDKVMLLVDKACVPTGTGENCAVTDTTNPAIALTAPTANSTVKGVTTVTATASDDSGIEKVEFYLDGSATPLKTITGVANYSFSWDSTKVADGPHAIAAKATDNAGNSATTPATTFTVANTVVPTPTPSPTPTPTPAPTPSPTPQPTPSPTPSPTPVPTPTPTPGKPDVIPPKIKKLTNNASVSRQGKVNIKVVATDNVKVAKLDVYVDNALLDSAAGNRISTTWNVKQSGAKAGKHTILIRATDTSGNIGSRSVIVWVR